MLKDTPRKTEVLQIRLEPELKALFFKALETKGISAGEWIRKSMKNLVRRNT